jgi:CxxC-x17-CxxC domain-containing protein
MIKGPPPLPDPVPGDAATVKASERPSATLPGVKLIKRGPVAPPEPEAPREKICSECGHRFRMDGGKKFYLCPDCYRRSFVYNRGGAGDAARVLIHITCSKCGSQEYLPFLPDDPAKALCRACFAIERPEPRRPSKHSRR